MTGSLKFLQINLAHSKAAAANLVNICTDLEPNVLFLQEPYSFNNKLAGISLSDMVFMEETNPRCAIVFRNFSHLQLNVFCVYLNSDLIVLKCSLLNTEILLLNCYVSPSASLNNFLITLEPILRRHRQNHLVLGGDFNAKNPLWGGVIEDERGTLLSEFFIANSLNILNNPNSPPTFETRNGSSWIDLVVISMSLLQFCQSWEVLEEPSCSDHKYISYTIFGTLNLSIKRVTKKGRNQIYEFIKRDTWFERAMQDSAKSPEIVKIALDVLYKKWVIWQRKVERTVKLSSKRNPWWNDELEVMRKKLRAMRRRFQRCHSILRNFYQNEYYSFLKQFQAAILAEKKLSWHQFCTDSAKLNIFGLTYKIASGKIKSPLIIPPIINTDGILTDSLRDSVSIILNTLFQEDNEELDSPFHSALRLEASHPPKSAPDLFFTSKEIENIVKSLPERTTPGLDGFRTSDVKYIWSSHPSFLVALFNSCLKWGYFPQIWRIGRIILLHKPGKPKDSGKSYRPICLNSILGKVLERLMLQRLYFFLKSKKLIHPMQFGFTSGVSSTMALMTLKNALLENKRNHIHSVIISLDFQGAFDSLWYPFVLKFLKTHDCPANLYSLLFQFFQNRSVVYQMVGESLQHPVSVGCPQGSPLSPLLWNVLIYDFLNLKLPIDVHVQAYADDIIILVSGSSRSELERKAHIILQSVLNWVLEHRLTLNPAKCTCLLVPSGKVFQNRPPIIKINDTNLKFVTEMKILGVVFDKVLSFLPHVKMLRGKVSLLTTRLSVFSGIHWGISGQQFRELYLRCIEKVITYAAPVWWKDENNSHLLRSIVSVQRIPLLRICKAFHTVNNISLPVLCNVLPISLVLSFELKKFEIFVQRKTIQYTNHIISPNDVDFPIDIWVTHPSKRISIPFLKDQVVLMEKKSFQVYTDASLCNLGITTVGAAFVIMNSQSSIVFHQKFKLPPHCSIYLAELWALFKAFEFINFYSHAHVWYIFSDSLSALQALLNPITSNSLIFSIKTLYAKLITKHTVNLYWVKGHSNNLGNDIADNLANSARNFGDPITIKLAPRHIKNNLKDYYRNEWNSLWMRDGYSKPLFSWVPCIHLIPPFFPPSYELTQFFTEHGRFPFYLFKRKISSDSSCPCGALISSISHYIESCPLLSNYHNRFLQLFPKGYSNTSKTQMLKSSAVIKIFEEMITFVNESVDQF